MRGAGGDLGHPQDWGGPGGTRLTVAINAQIDPAHPGGVETALAGLLAHLGRASDAERYLVLAIPGHAEAVAGLTGEGQQVVAWPYPQKAGAPIRTPGRRWRALHRRAGPLAPAVDLAHRGLWAARRSLARPAPLAVTDRALRARGVDVVHLPYPIRFATALPYVYEPWDLQHRHHPEFFSAEERAWRDRMYREGCEEARLVVTATRWTKDDVVRQYGIDPRKVAVIPRPPWLPRPIPDAEAAARTLAPLGLPERFALYPAMTFPHKNHLRLLDALALLRDRDGIELPLACTGRPYEPHAPVVRERIARLGLGGQVWMLGAVPDDVLAALYRRATLLAFPSLFEGLGLPVLEALAYGLPVLAADATCLPEVAGDAALYFDGADVASIADALRRALTEPGLLAALAERAPAALARYSWERAAATFVACYRHAAGEPLSAEQAALLAEATA